MMNGKNYSSSGKCCYPLEPNRRSCGKQKTFAEKKGACAAVAGAPPGRGNPKGSERILEVPR